MDTSTGLSKYIKYTMQDEDLNGLWDVTTPDGLDGLDSPKYGEEDEMVDKVAEAEFMEKAKQEETANFINNLKPLLSRVKDTQLLLTQIFKTPEERELLLESILLVLAEDSVTIDQPSSILNNTVAPDIDSAFKEMALKYAAKPTQVASISKDDPWQ